ncbi:hypothetical protein POTOM_014061 [Populus tomentosa]|uniref:protein-serine/threonine phosphatase n=1 Tax=Populus tomentosa TaxID=118781 RepID=A0A8X8A760_POPTO|nr:hypothetical protein POTOM_014061 [Populus tomentosa]
MAPRKYLIEVEKAKEAKDGKPSIGPVYRSLFAKDGFPPPVPGLESCWDVFRMSVEKYPNNPMLGRREIVNGKAGEYVWQTYKQVYDVVVKVGNSIRSCGVEPGAKCGIYGANCAEWIMSMEACNAHGLYCVPLYDTLGASAVEFIICHSEVSIAFVEENKICELLKTFPNSTQYLKTIVSFGKVALKEQEEIERSGLAVYSWDEFLKLGENKQYELPLKKKEDICTIMYTSGTTGDPKGVLISNDSIVTLIAGVKRLLESVKESLTSEDVYLSYLPLAHIFDRNDAIAKYAMGVPNFGGDWDGLQQKVSTGGFLKKTLFNVAYSQERDRDLSLYARCCKFSSMKKGHAHHQASPICDKIVFNKVRQGLGGKVRLILSGAAPLSNHVEAFLRVVSCAHVLQGYGLTETCAGTFVSLPNELPMLGTVGPPVPNVDVCLESVPEMGYDALSSTPRGEICIRGKTLFAGYYKREDLTEEVLNDGWFHTGDIGEWQPDGSMKIIDRKKNIFKLSQGEYVAVENLENIYSLVSDIDSIWVYGNSFESFLVAVANPNQQALEHWAQEHGISGDFKSLCENPKAKEYMLGELTMIGKEKKVPAEFAFSLKGFEFIKAIHLDPEPFDMERDLITPTYKKKRPQLLKYYQVVIKPPGIVEAGSDGEEDEDKNVTCKLHGMMSVIGWWRVMEDAVTMVPSVAIGEFGRYNFFAVYDGHGGARVANACSDRMHQLVAKEVAKGERIGWGKGLEYWEKLMGACFEKMDGELMLDNESGGGDREGSVVSKEYGFDSSGGDGDGGELWGIQGRLCVAAAWQCLCLMIIRRLPDERERVEAAGGRVINWNGSRVVGVLATLSCSAEAAAMPAELAMARGSRDNIKFYCFKSFWRDEMSCRTKFQATGSDRVGAMKMDIQVGRGYSKIRHKILISSDPLPYLISSSKSNMQAQRYITIQKKEDSKLLEVQGKKALVAMN